MCEESVKLRKKDLSNAEGVKNTKTIIREVKYVLSSIRVKQNTSDSKWQRIRTYITKTLTTKRCPHCQTHITKNGGCNSVTCTACGKTFLWGRAFGTGKGIATRNVQTLSAHISSIIYCDLLFLSKDA